MGSLLQHDCRAWGLRRLVTGNPQEVSKAANQTFSDLPESHRVAALSDLIPLLVGCQDPATGTPLLSARYHLFLRALRVLSYRLRRKEEVVLDRRSERDTSHFEVALCRECGQHYLVGKIDNGKLGEAIRDPGLDEFEATFFRPLIGGPLRDEDDDGNETETYKLCAECAAICRSSGELPCGHNAVLIVEKEERAGEREDQVLRCGVCGYRAPDPVREVIHGTDGPHAVIATTLHQELPPERRKVLAFADGRQEAAFFAWYLGDSYKSIRARNLLLKVLQRQSVHSSAGSSFRDVAIRLRDTFRRKNVFPATWSDLDLAREAWLTLYREFLTDEPRISLEGVALMRWEVKWPDWFQTPTALTAAPWSLTDQEARNAVFLLLDSMRANRAVELHADNSVSLSWTDLLLQATQSRVSDRQKARAQDSAETKWAGKTGRRARFFEKLCRRINPRATENEPMDAALRVLGAVWESLAQCDRAAPTEEERLLVRVDDARRLNPDWWRLRFVEPEEQIYRCGTCNRIATVPVRDVCARHGCPGSLSAVKRSDLGPNHYRSLYEAELPGSLRSRGTYRSARQRKGAGISAGVSRGQD